VQENAYNDDSEMFDLIHAMRARIMTSPAFTGAKVIGAILFEQTMDREVEGLSTPAYLWQQKNVVPFLKIDKGLEDIADDVQRLRPINGLRDTLDRARALGVYGTKERSVIHGANEAGIKEIAAQQFELGREVLDAGLMPILEPEINIAIADKSEAEAMLRDALLAELDQMDRQVMLKLSIPTEANLYQPLVNHPNVLKVVALSGGYVRNEANAMLAQNNGMKKYLIRFVFGIHRANHPCHIGSYKSSAETVPKQ